MIMKCCVYIFLSNPFPRLQHSPLEVSFLSHCNIEMNRLESILVGSDSLQNVKHLYLSDLPRLRTVTIQENCLSSFDIDSIQCNSRCYVSQ